MRSKKALRIKTESLKSDNNKVKFKLVGLSRQAEFRNLMKCGRRVNHESMSAVIYFQPDGSNILLIKTAYAVLKKTFPKAVTRNRIKRRLRAALRAILAEKLVGASGVLFLKRTPSISIVQTSFKQLYSDLMAMLNRVL